MKKGLFTLLCLLLLLLIPVSASADTLVLPAQLQQIEAEAFRNDASLETVILPDGVTSIGAYAFAGSGLQSINLPRTIRSIADTAFQNCTGLTVSTESDTYAYNWCVSHGIAIDIAAPISLGTTNVTIGTGGTVRYYFVPTWSGSYTLYSTGSLDTLAYLYDAAGEQLAYNDDGGEGYNFSLTYDFTAGNVYYYEVRFWSSSTTGSFSVTLSADFGVQITKQPFSTTVYAGETASFSVEVSGSSPRFQWQERASGSSAWQNCTLSGNKTKTLSFTANNSHNGKQYRCIVTDSYGFQAISGEATLYVATPGTSVRRALLVGNNAYYSGALSGCINDATAMRDMLSGLGNFFNCTLVTDATADQMKNAIRSTFAGASNNDVSLFYYSGHGMNANGGEAHGALVGVNYGLDYYDYLTTKALAEAFSGVQGRVIVILDSCHSGATIGKAASSFHSDMDAFNQSVVEAFSAYDTTVYLNGDDLTAQSGELAASKFVVITAARSAEESAEFTSNGISFGAFTHFFVEGCGCSYFGGYSGSMPADTNSNNQLTVNEIYTYAKDNAANWNSGQTAQVYASNMNEVLFRR